MDLNDAHGVLHGAILHACAYVHETQMMQIH